MTGLERPQQNWERKQRRQERLVEEVALADQSNDDHARYFVSDNVVNLSRRILTKDQIDVLSRGLKFCPTPKEIDESKLN